MIDKRWNFNGDVYRPTFVPGISTTGCVSFITNGRITFTLDSTHWLRGKTADLPEMP